MGEILLLTLRRINSIIHADGSSVLLRWQLPDRRWFARNPGM
jgi:hypothetical protein